MSEKGVTTSSSLLCGTALFHSLSPIQMEESQSLDCDKEVVLISDSGVMFSRCGVVSIVDTDFWGAPLSNSVSHLSLSI